MCYLVREQQRAAEPGGAVEPPSLARLRPRLIGVAAATLIGGLAVAAVLVVPPSTPSHAKAKDLGAPVPISSSAGTVPATAVLERSSPVIEQTSAPIDDGVPSSEVANAGMGQCHHGL